MIVHVVEFSRGSFESNLSILELLIISLTFTHLLLKCSRCVFILPYLSLTLVSQIVLDLFSASYFGFGSHTSQHLVSWVEQVINIIQILSVVKV